MSAPLPTRMKRFEAVDEVLKPAVQILLPNKGSKIRLFFIDELGAWFVIRLWNVERKKILVDTFILLKTLRPLIKPNEIFAE